MKPLYFFRRYRLYDLYKSIWRKYWYSLDQKMNMIIINSYLQKTYLIPFFNTMACFFQGLLDFIRKNFSSIFCWAYKMIKQQTFIMTLHNMFTHIVKIFFILTPTQISGKYLFDPDSRVGEFI